LERIKYEKAFKTHNPEVNVRPGTAANSMMASKMNQSKMKSSKLANSAVKSSGNPASQPSHIGKGI
jgi:hypothetical protein